MESTGNFNSDDFAAHDRGMNNAVMPGGDIEGTGEMEDDFDAEDYGEYGYDDDHQGFNEDMQHGVEEMAVMKMIGNGGGLTMDGVPTDQQEKFLQHKHDDRQLENGIDGSGTVMNENDNSSSSINRGSGNKVMPNENSNAFMELPEGSQLSQDGVTTVEQLKKEFDSALNDTKDLVTTLLNGIVDFFVEMESVHREFEEVKDFARSETHRLNELEPDVERAASMHLTMPNHQVHDANAANAVAAVGDSSNGIDQSY